MPPIHLKTKQDCIPRIHLANTVGTVPSGHTRNRTKNCIPRIHHGNEQMTVCTAYTFLQADFE